MGKSSDSDFKVHKQGSHIFKVSRIHKNKKRRKNNTKKTINKLFDQLRNESVSVNSQSSCSSTSVTDDTVIEVPSDNCKEQNTNLIIIKDDDEILQNETYSSNLPLHSSTPIASKSRILQESTDTPCKANSNPFKKFNEDVINLTREINMDSYLTVDLTNDSANTSKEPKIDTVIDLVNTSEDCTLRNTSSMSGDSDVTVINTAKRKRKSENNMQMKKFASTIAKLDSTEKDKLLELIAKKIFNGCKTPTNRSLHSLKNGINQATETLEDTYIKEVILGKKISRNSIGSNIYNPIRDIKNRKGLRMIVIDGSNVAMQHTKGQKFSVEGLEICINYFLQKDHVVKAFVPRFRCKYGKSTNGKLLDRLEREGHVVYTPSREVQGRMITSYDDRYIVQCAAEFDGVIVSGDYYRDLLNENPRWRFVIENRLLQFTWVGDMIMFPKDPLGKNGPTLQEFLRHPE